MSNTTWKPGTAKPAHETSPTVDRKPASREVGDMNGSNDESSPPKSSESKKKLSGATMSMRFMQRKRQADDGRKKTLEQQQEQPMEWKTTEQQEQQQVEKEDETAQLPPQEATASEMYGLKSDLIGRRSFGGFRPSVETTWKSARKTWSGGKTGEQSNKETISDEELLRRYKDYVSGKGDFGGVDPAAAAPIGNLEEKLKKGKRRGEKRKR